MAKESSGANTAPGTVATAAAGNAGTSAEQATQENNVTTQLTELQARLTELEGIKGTLEKEKNEAVAARLREEAKYKGLQNQTTRTLQQAAEDRRVLENMNKDRSELAEMKSVLETLANRVLDEPERKEMEFKQRELKLKLAEQAQVEASQRIQAQAAQAVASTQYQNPEDEKARFLNYYFPGSGIDSTDPNIDWGDGAESTQEAFRRFTVSVTTIKNQQDQANSQNAMAVMKKQTEDALAELKAKEAELVTKTSEEIAAAKADAIVSARKDSEKKLRALGADVSGTPAPDGSRKSFGQQLEEELPDDLLRTKSGTIEYTRRIEALKQQLRGR
jgi:DNA repair exonuclease SbcCD ATPase subunit